MRSHLTRTAAHPTRFAQLPPSSEISAAGLDAQAEDSDSDVRWEPESKLQLWRRCVVALVLQGSLHSPLPMHMRLPSAA